MDLSSLFGAVSRVIADRTGPVDQVDTGGFLNEVTGMFRQHAEASGQQFDDSHGSQYANQYQGQEVLPASMDPMGDPADQGQYQDQSILPASEDPLGDPADEEAPRGYGR